MKREVPSSLTLKAYECFLRGSDEGTIYYAKTASKARAKAWRDIGDSYDGMA